MGTGQKREHIAVPAKGYRVARCIGCGQGFTWKHADPIGCPDCGSAILTTSTRQRRAGFFEVTGDELTAARIVGLRDQAAYTRKAADRSYENAGEIIMDPAWIMGEDGYVRKGDGREYGGWALAAIIEQAGRKLAKAERAERKADKLARG